MHTTRRFALVLGMAAVLPAFAQSKVDPVNKDGSGVAIKGYDPVAYFTQSKPVKGSASFTHQWMNSTWWFASAEDRDEFELHAAEDFRLVETKQAGLVEKLLVLTQQNTGILGPLRAFAQRGHDLARAAHRLVIGDAGEVAPHRLRQRPDRTE